MRAEGELSVGLARFGRAHLADASPMIELCFVQLVPLVRILGERGPTTISCVRPCMFHAGP